MQMVEIKPTASGLRVNPMTSTTERLRMNTSTRDGQEDKGKYREQTD